MVSAVFVAVLMVAPHCSVGQLNSAFRSIALTDQSVLHGRASGGHHNGSIPTLHLGMTFLTSNAGERLAAVALARKCLEGNRSVMTLQGTYLDI